MIIENKMAKQDQVLILDPAQELHFKEIECGKSPVVSCSMGKALSEDCNNLCYSPFTDVVTSYLKLNNPSDRRVCFKVKTTAPKKYCVRPNSGIIEPKQVVSVAVMLQPFDYNPNEKNKHKFMVQTMFVPEGDLNSFSQDNLWRDAKPESLMDSKLKCVFDMPTEGVQNSNLDTNAVQTEDKTNASKIVPETSVKASPKVTNTDHELKKILEDNKRLREECQFLKQENVQLKEEQLRRRVNPTGDSGSRSTAASHHVSNPSQKECMPTFSEKEQQQSPMLYLAVILTIGLLGIFIGKFIV